METLKLIGNITTADFPGRITESISSIPSLDWLNARLHRGGILILENATLFIGEINNTQESYFGIGVAKLKLINSRIVTNGNLFEIFCNELETDTNSHIDSFDRTTADSGINGTVQNVNGTEGGDGDNGGPVRISLTNKISGRFTINLSGQNGGNGGQGYNGKPGINGQRGRSARNGPFGTCRRGPGNGSHGTNGQSGGNGGDGGNGGSGGIFYVNYIEVDPQSDLVLNFTAKSANVGHGGLAGTGGKGGLGGKAGSNAGNCHIRGRAGRAGADGQNGIAGLPGEPGTDGRSIIQRVDLNQLEFAHDFV